MQDHQLLELAGVWIQATGTAISAIGNTITVKFKTEDAEKIATKFVIIGNGLEATGNSFQAIATSKSTENKEEKAFSVIGAWFQAGGNSTNAVAGTLSLKGDEEGSNQLDVLGDTFQSMGALFEAKGASLSDAEFSQMKFLGLSLQSAGSMIEAIGVTFLLKEKKEIGEQVVAFGSYVQTGGETIAALAVTKQFEVDSGLRPPM